MIAIAMIYGYAFLVGFLALTGRARLPAATFRLDRFGLRGLALLIFVLSLDLAANVAWFSSTLAVVDLIVILAPLALAMFVRLSLIGYLTASVAVAVLAMLFVPALHEGDGG